MSVEMTEIEKFLLHQITVLQYEVAVLKDRIEDLKPFKKFVEEQEEYQQADDELDALNEEVNGD